MRFALKALPLCALSLFATAAAAQNAPAPLRKPYVALNGSYVEPDGDRDAYVGAGWDVLYGLPLTRTLALEANLGGGAFERETDDEYDYTYHLGVDAILNANDNPKGYGVFLIAGIGAAYEDIRQFENLYPQANGGLGVLLPTGLDRLSLRGEARYVATFGKDEVNEQTVFGEARLSLGLQYALGNEAVAPAAVPADSDGDGVTDASDLCPGTPPGSVVDANGCLASAPVSDADGDGVSDTLDQCPGTPPGTAVDASGCALPQGNKDSDGDGVPDATDQCPATPEGFKVDGIGCLVEQAVSLRSINFELNADTLTPEAAAILDGIAASLAAQPKVSLRVIGHTDALGPQSYNLSLSQRRAKAVKTYLSGKGVAAARLSAEGEGEFRPEATNDTEAGRALNRRVEFVVQAN